MATLTKYHKTDTGKLAPCTATKRACKYGAAEHTFLSADQQLFMRDVLGVIDAGADLNLAAADVRADLARDVQAAQPVSAAEVEAIIDRKLADAAFSSEYGVTREAWNTLTAEPFSKNYKLDGFNEYDSPASYEYDSYGNPPGYDDTYDDGYGRAHQYGGLRISPRIEAEAVARKFFNPKNDAALQVAVGYVKANRLDQPEAYRAVARGGYYGEEAAVEIADWADAKVAGFRDAFPLTVPSPVRKPRRGSGAKV